MESTSRSGATIVTMTTQGGLTEVLVQAKALNHASTSCRVAAPTETDVDIYIRGLLVMASLSSHP
jgi:hypothetical protein